MCTLYKLYCISVQSYSAPYREILNVRLKLWYPDWIFHLYSPYLFLSNRNSNRFIPWILTIPFILHIITLMSTRVLSGPPRQTFASAATSTTPTSCKRHPPPPPSPSTYRRSCRPPPKRWPPARWNGERVARPPSWPAPPTIGSASCARWSGSRCTWTSTLTPIRGSWSVVLPTTRCGRPCWPSARRSATWARRKWWASSFATRRRRQQRRRRWHRWRFEADWRGGRGHWCKFKWRNNKHGYGEWLETNRAVSVFICRIC